MAITRIKNNQITDASAGNIYLGVNAAAKLQDYSITSGKIANDLTYNSSLTITGNLTVQGNTTQIDTTNLVVEDPIIILASEQTGTAALDIGYLGERGDDQNIAFVWKEDADTFVAAFTNDLVTNTTITVASFADFKANNIVANGTFQANGTSTLVGNVEASNIEITANSVIIVNSGTTTDFNLINLSNVADPVGAQDVATKNYVDSSLSSIFTLEDDATNTTTIADGDTVQMLGTANEVDVVVGNLSVTFGLPDDVTIGNTLTVTANVDAGNVNTTDIDLSGNVISALNVTGNIAGPNINIDGRVYTATLETTGNALIGGNLVVQGNITYINIDDLRVEDPIIILGTGPNGAPLTVDDGKDRGIYMEYYTTGLGNAYMGWQNSSGNIIIANDVSFSGNDVVAVNAYGTLEVGNIYAESADVVGNITGGNITTAGIANIGTLEVTGTTSLTGNIISDVKVTSNVTANNFIAVSSISAGTTIVATGNITGGNLDTAGQAVVTGNITGGNINTGGQVVATGNITGGNVIGITAGQFGNIVISGDDITDVGGGIVNINSGAADVDFAVNGDTTANLFYVDAGTGTASFGSETQTTNALVSFNSSNSILLPVGNTAQRPATGVTGMVRFNTSLDSLEFYDADSWVSAGTVFTVIDSEVFNGDGSTVQFTLGTDQTTDSCIVSINGVVQIPVTAYAVSGNVLTFTEAPLSQDVIEVREITTTVTVKSILNSVGNAGIEVSDTTNDVAFFGDLIPQSNNAQTLGTTTSRFAELYLSGSSLILGNIVLKNETGNTLAFYGPDGTTPGTLSSNNVDTTQIVNGTSNVSVISSGGNVDVNVGGNPIATFHAGGIDNRQSNGVGNIGTSSSYFNTVFAKATSAQYADLAEMYEADADIAPGTVVCFGGDKEVTTCDTANSRRVAGVVSTNPSYLMNSAMEGEHVVAVALTGRVPCRVVGTVEKGDLMVAAGGGAAMANNDAAVGTVIGKALENFAGVEGVIEVVVGRV